MAKDHSKPLVLCVASQPEFLTDLKKTLKPEFDVHTASSIASAQNFLKKKSVRILLAAHPLENEKSFDFLKSALDENPELVAFLLDTQQTWFSKSRMPGERFAGVLRPPFDDGILPALHNAAGAQLASTRSEKCAEKLAHNQTEAAELQRHLDICNERLKGQQAVFYNLVQSDSDAILVINREKLTIAEMNKSAEQLFKTPAEKIVNQPFTSFLSQKTRETLITNNGWLEKLFELTRDNVYDMDVIDAEGNTVSVQARMSIFPVYPPDLESPVEEITVINLRDVSEQKRVENQLRASQREYRNLLESIPQRIFYKDLNSGFVGINKSLAEDLETTEKEVVGKTDFDLFPAELARKHQKDDKEIIEKRITTDRQEIHKIHGKDRNVRTIKTPLIDEHDRVVGVLGVSWDITDEVRALRDLEWERHLFKAFMDHVPENIYFKDQQSRFVRVNRAFVRYFKFDKEKDIIGKTDADLFAPEHAEQALQDEKHVMKTGQPLMKEEREVWPDRPDTWVSTVKLPLYDQNGELIGTYGISHDITERVRAELQVQENNEELELINEINMAATRNEPIEHIIKNVFIFLERLCQAHEIAFFQYDKEQDRLVHVENTIDPKVIKNLKRFLGDQILDYTPKLVEGGKYKQSLDTGKSFVVYDSDSLKQLYKEWIQGNVSNYIVRKAAELMNVKGVGAVPLATHQGPLGIITFNTEAVVSSQLLNRLDRFASQVAVVLDHYQSERQLRESREQLKMAIEASNIGIWRWNVEDDQMWWDDKTRTIFGISEKRQPTIKFFFSLIHPDDRGRIESQINQIFLGDKISDLTFRIVQPSGDNRHLVLRGKVTRNRINEVVRMTGVCLDITEQIKSEQALQQSEQRIQAIAQALPDLIFTIDQDYRYMDVVTSQSDLLLAPAEEIEGKTLRQVLPKKMANILQDVAQKTLDSGEIQVAEYQLDVPAGKRWFEARTALVDYEFDHKKAIVLIVRDIQDRKQAELELKKLNDELEERVAKRTQEVEKAHEQVRENEERLSLAFSGTGFAWWDWDYEANVVKTHPNKFKMLGYQESEDKRVDWWIDQIHPDDVENANQAMRQLLAGKTDLYDVEYRLRTVDDEWRWVLDRGTVSSRKKDGTPRRILGAVQDIQARKEIDQERERQNQFMQTLLRTLPSPIYYIDKDGFYTGCNRAFEEFFGIRERDLLGKTVHDVASAERASEYEKSDREMLQNPGTQQIERIVKNANGEKRETVFNKATIVDANNQPVGLITIISDITEIKRAEEALRQSEERYRKLFDNSPDGIFIADVETLYIDYVNSAGCKMLGYTEAELLDMKIPDVHPKGAIPFKQDEKLKKFIQGEKGSVIDVPALRKDGSTVFVNLRSVNILIDDRPHTMAIFRDISDRRKAEQALEESEKRFRELSDLLPQMIFELDLEGHFMYLNKHGQHALGIGEDEKQEQFKFCQLVQPEHCPVAENLIKQASSGKTIQPTEIELERADGSDFPCVVYAAAINREGQFVGIRGIAVDISERKKAEKEMRRHTRELEIFNKAMVGREKRIIELKEETNELAKALGRSLPYPPVWNE